MFSLKALLNVLSTNTPRMHSVCRGRKKYPDFQRACCGSCVGPQKEIKLLKEKRTYKVVIASIEQKKDIHTKTWTTY